MISEKQVIELLNPIKMQCPSLIKEEIILLKEILKQNIEGIKLALKFFSSGFIAGCKEIEKQFSATGSEHRIAPNINIYSGIILKTTTETGNLETLKLLDEAGCDFNVTADSLWEICITNFQTHQPIFDFLLRKNVPLSEQTLHFAMKRNNITVFKILFPKLKENFDTFLKWALELDGHEFFKIIFFKELQTIQLQKNTKTYVDLYNKRLTERHNDYKFSHINIFKIIFENLINDDNITKETKIDFVQYYMIVTVWYGSEELLTFLLSQANALQLDINQITIPSDLRKRSVYIADSNTLLEIALAYVHKEISLILLLAGSQFKLDVSIDKLYVQNWNKSIQQETRNEIISYLFMAEAYKLLTQFKENTECDINVNKYLAKAQENTHGYTRYLNHLLKFDSQPPLKVFQWQQLLQMLNSQRLKISCLETTLLFATALMAQNMGYQNSAFYFTHWLYHSTYKTNDEKNISPSGTNDAENISPFKVYQNLVVCSVFEAETNKKPSSPQADFFKSQPRFEAQLHCLFFQILHTTAQYLQAQQKWIPPYWIPVISKLNIDNDTFIGNLDQSTSQKPQLLNQALSKFLEKFSQITKIQPTTVNNFLLNEFSNNPHANDNVFKKACESIFLDLCNNYPENVVIKTLQTQFQFTRPKSSKFTQSPPSNNL